MNSTVTLTFDSNNRNVKGLLAYLKSLDYVKVETESEYDPEFVKKIRKGEKDILEGKGKAIKLEDLWK